MPGLGDKSATAATANLEPLLWAAALLGTWLFPPVFAAIPLAFLAVWSIAEVFVRRAPARPVWGLAALAAGTAAFAVRLPELVATEQLGELSVSLADRARLATHPSIAPAVVRDDRPQLFYVYAPGARKVALAFAPDRRFEAEALGHDLFRAHYDPRRHGAPASGRVTLYADSRSVERTLELGRASPHPRRLCVSRDGALAAIPSEETDELLVINATGDLTRIAVGDGPTDCAFLDSDTSPTLAVSHRYGGVLRVAIGGALSPLATGRSAHALALSANGLTLAIAWRDAPGLELIDPNSGARITSATAAPALDSLAFGTDGDTLIAASLHTLSLHRFRRHKHTLLEDRAPISLGRPVVAMARAPDGKTALVAVTDFRPERDAGPNHEVADQLLELDTEDWRIRRRHLTARTSPDGEVVGGASPLGLYGDEDGWWIAFGGTGDLARLDARGGPSEAPELTPFETSPTSDPQLPHGIARLTDRVLVTSAIEGTIAVFDLNGRRIRAHRLTREKDPRARLVRDGERAFWEATRSGTSCQSCHLHGGSDRAPHDIGHGAPRPTLDVRGIAHTAPYLRGASYPSLGALEVFANTLLGGYARHVPERTAALEAYLSTSAPPDRPEPKPSPDTLRAGLSAFVRAACPTCHAFPAFTDLSQVPAPFLFPDRPDDAHLLDTPSLIAVGASAPYLFDGRAPDLRAVLTTHNRAGRHGNVDRLSSVELEALLAFLQAL